LPSKWGGADRASRGIEQTGIENLYRYPVKGPMAEAPVERMPIRAQQIARGIGRSRWRKSRGPVLSAWLSGASRRRQWRKLRGQGCNGLREAGLMTECYFTISVRNRDRGIVSF
jgi:hypothetical protein